MDTKAREAFEIIRKFLKRRTGEDELYLSQDAYAAMQGEFMALDATERVRAAQDKAALEEVRAALKTAIMYMPTEFTHQREERARAADQIATLDKLMGDV